MNMSLFNIKEQETYKVVDGLINFDNAMNSEQELFSVLLKKQTNQHSTNFETPQAKTNQKTKKTERKKNQTQANCQSEIFIEPLQLKNQHSGFVLEGNSQEYEPHFYNFDSSANFFCQSENILSHENDLRPIDPQTEVSTTEQKADKNDSKNVPKGMKKAFAHWVLSKKPQTIKIVKRFFDDEGANYEKYKEYLKKIRKSAKISIQNIRDMLLTEEFAVITRKLVNFFMRKIFISHIYNSKMEKRQIHLKYIPRWLEIFKDPNDFRSLK